MKGNMTMNNEQVLYYSTILLERLTSYMGTYKPGELPLYQAN
jgi:hypothetical protein